MSCAFGGLRLRSGGRLCASDKRLRDVRREGGSERASERVSYPLWLCEASWTETKAPWLRGCEHLRQTLRFVWLARGARPGAMLSRLAGQQLCAASSATGRLGRAAASPLLGRATPSAHAVGAIAEARRCRAGLPALEVYTHCDASDRAHARCDASRYFAGEPSVPHRAHWAVGCTNMCRLFGRYLWLALLLGCLASAGSGGSDRQREAPQLCKSASASCRKLSRDLCVGLCCPSWEGAFCVQGSRPAADPSLSL